jgi:tol-pal system protein YbgF
MAKVDGLASDLQNLTGRLEENGHLLSQLTQKIEDSTSRMQGALGRLDSLEARINSLESVGARQPPAGGELNEKSILPGRSLDGTPKGTGITPTEAYNLAYNDYLKGNYDLALMGFQNFLQQYPTSSRIPQVLYWMGEAYYAKRDYDRAIEWFDRVVQEYPRSEKAVNSLLKKGVALQDQGKRELARETFKRVVEQFPFTNEAELAKNRLAELR